MPNDDNQPRRGDDLRPLLADIRQALAEHRQDIETGLTLIAKRQDALERNQMMMAGVQ